MPTLSTGLVSQRAGQPQEVWAYFAIGQNTSQIGVKLLPGCTTPEKEGGDFVKLMNERTGDIIKQHGMYKKPTSITWNTSAFSNLSLSLAGRYICKNQAGVAVKKYNLNVVGKFTIQIACSDTCNGMTFRTCRVQYYVINLR